MEEYKPYQHVCKLGSRDTDGILNGKVYVFPKIDGTNAHIWTDDGGEIHYGSRKRELSLGKDNAGFMANMVASREFDSLMGSLPNGWHVFGEWLVPHTLKTYEDDAWRKFYIFDIVDCDGVHIDFDSIVFHCERGGIYSYIRPIAMLDSPCKDDLMKLLDMNKFLIKDGDGLGEGVVIKNYDYFNCFGRQTWGKIVSTDFKASHRRSDKATIARSEGDVEQRIVEAFLTRDIIDKVVAHIELDQDTACAIADMDRSQRGRAIPRLIETVWHDFINECMFDALKKFKNPTVDYKYLRRLVTSRIKEVKSELF